MACPSVRQAETFFGLLYVAMSHDAAEEADVAPVIMIDVTEKHMIVFQVATSCPNAVGVDNRRMVGEI
jgi:hypothetical protein